jgi:hypothetical protein
MLILEKVAATLGLLFGMIFLYFPGGFGVLHFKQGRPRIVRLAVSSVWIAFIVVHVLAMYRIWFTGDSMVAWLISLFIGQVVFFSTIARDVSTT